MKFLSNSFNPETGISQVTLADKYGRYTGIAKLHPDDIQHKNEITGFRLAERRAWIKSLKDQLYRKRYMLKAIKDLKKDFEFQNCELDKKTLRRINLKLRDYTQNIEELKNAIHLFQEETKKDIQTRERLLKKRTKTSN